VCLADLEATSDGVQRGIIELRRFKDAVGRGLLGGSL
jgi:hypothetical protein